MGVFNYKAVNAAGKTVSAELEAADRRELMLKLRDLGLSPTEIAETAAAPSSAAVFPRGFSSNRIFRKHITQFTAQLSALVNAKMNLEKALVSLERQSANTGVNAIVKSLLADVQKGKNLSDALQSHPAYFSAMYVNMIKIGEVGGVLEKSLARLVEMRAKEEELVGKIKSALTYPSVMACVMLGSVVVMLTFVIPRFSGVFGQMGASLPLSTRVVMGASGFLCDWWWLLLITVAAAAAAAVQLLRREEYRLKFDQIKLSLPLLGHIIHGVSVSRFSLSMGALLSSGVSMMKALDAAIPVAGNSFMEKTLRQVAREVREGDSLFNALRKRPGVFPTLMIGMIGTGEETGALNDTFTNVGEYFRKDSEDSINTLTTLFEPAMILVMGGIVGFIISAILLPIFNVSSSIN